MQTKIDEQKKVHEEKIQEFSAQVREYLTKNTNDGSDYLRFRQDMVLYHRGAYNALIELEKAIAQP
jgi:uncharacterized protein YijF (DUF1287 family)